MRGVKDLMRYRIGKCESLEEKTTEKKIAQDLRDSGCADEKLRNAIESVYGCICFQCVEKDEYMENQIAVSQIQ